MLLVHVAVPVPQLDLLTYRVPDGMPAPAAGARVLVPLGSRQVTGIVVESSANAPAGSAKRDLKELAKVLDPEAFVPADVVELARWVAEYDAAGAGETILAVLPPQTRGTRVDAHKNIRIASITAAGLEAVDVASAFRRKIDLPAEAGSHEGKVTTKQRDVLDRLTGVAAGLPVPELVSAGIGADTLARLARAGLVSIRRERVDRDPFATSALSFAGSKTGAIEVEGGCDLTLTSEQTMAVSRLRRLAGSHAFRVALLHGVTGSGKTEVYLRLAAEVRGQGRRVLMMVPEIGLTPAIAGRFRERFGDRVAIQHSGLSDGERHDQWQRVRRGDVDMVIGTRSAVFAPVERLGLIIVDEEHDGSYKQEESPRYNGRDVAIVRGQRAGALVVLGSATPSMESYHRAIEGRYERVVLERRVLDCPLAAVRVVDMKEEYAAEGPDVVLSRPLREAIEARLQRGEQSLVLLNRRGFATAVFCRQCAGTLDCPNCSVSLVIHGEGSSRRARCHYCNYAVRVPPACPACAGPYLEQTGCGTERVEAEVRKLFPGARTARLDRDAVRRKGALAQTLSRFRDGAIDVMVGTQMIAKGHDFPGVTLVGVVSADIGLGTADFRSSERTFQLLTQVAGRAGRGEQPGEAIVQTINPTHYSIQLACRQDYPAFYERELQFRKAMRYPPMLSLVNTIVRSRTFSGAMEDAAGIADRVRRTGGDRFRVLGPAPAPLGRLRGEYRAQLLLKGTNRRAMREALRKAVAARQDLARRVIVDIDPISVL